MNRATEQVNSTLAEDIIAVATHRDQAALGRLFDHYVPRIRSFCLAAQPGSTLMADDIAQEVIIRVWNKADTFNPNTASLNTWIFTIARNARIDYLRKNGRHTSNIDPELLWNDVADESVDLFRDAQQARDKNRIHSGLSQLPTDQKQVLAKVYLEGKTHVETAQELGLPLGTIKSRVRLALHKLTIYIKR